MTAYILLVEDNADNLKLMSYLLRTFGHTVVTAGDGVEALELAHREPLDLIVCDIQLPRLDGYQVAQQLKRDPVLSKIPLVAVTALAMVRDRDKVLAAGFDGYMTKPIAPRTFVGQVEAFLGPERQAPQRPPVPAPAERPATSPPRGTILVMSNTQVNLKLARTILEPFGYRIVAARGVREALALARQSPPGLILSDLHLALENGYDLIREVKADPGLRTIPFLFISSTVWADSDREQNPALGASRFLLRPIAPHRLLAEVEGCLGGRREG